MLFRDRKTAGVFLAEKLRQYRNRHDVLILGLPRGGVPVAFEVAKVLKLPLDVFVVRKLGVPGHQELAMGAVASGGTRVLNHNIVEGLKIPDREIAIVTQRETEEVRRRETKYRGARVTPDFEGKTVILVDDGLATGATMRASVEALRQLHPAKIVAAVPVAAASSCRDLSLEADQVVCGMTPSPFFGVGQWYADFSETTDEEVRRLLKGARRAA